MNEKTQLEAMVGKSHESQLIMFLTGPGCSGKSKIVKGLLQYGKQYCMNLEVPFTEKNYTYYCVFRSGSHAGKW